MPLPPVLPHRQPSPAAPRQPSSGTRLSPPHAGFVMPFAVERTATGYRSTFDFDSIPSEITGTTYYVDGANGNDANPGTSGSPLKGLATACQKNDVGIVYVKAGTYQRNNTGNLFTQNISRNIAVIGWNGTAKYINSNRGNDSSWTSQGSGAYSTTLANMLAVLDLNQADANVAILPLQLTKRADLAAVQGASEGWATSGSTLYVKQTSGTTPNTSNIAFLRIADTLAFTASVIYMRDIWWLDSGGFRPTKSQYTPDAKFIARDCVFGMSNQATDKDALAVSNFGLAALKNCQAYYGGKDCFNYHCATDRTSPQTPVVLEEGCTSKYSAWRRTEPRGPYQATTTHDGVACVRLGGTYGPTLGGPCQQDQGDDDHTCYSWTLGSTLDATGSPDTEGELSTTWGYPVLGGHDTATWLDDCTLTDGGAGPVKADTEGPVRLHRCVYSGTPIGNVATY